MALMGFEFPGDADHPRKSIKGKFLGPRMPIATTAECREASTELEIPGSCRRA